MSAPVVYFGLNCCLRISMVPSSRDDQQLASEFEVSVFPIISINQFRGAYKSFRRWRKFTFLARHIYFFNLIVNKRIDVKV